ncbi:zinc finger protein [Trichinella spiralis]|uniref:zinc finger protein n=1 Tax=Trichinella spiralis TaxID=6334 RepID=UPI0001EFCDE1|nr:zinc finger protein [Trichinella spiralis]
MSAEDGLQCIICFEQREYFCVSSCDHAVCLTCVIRIMMLNDSKECPVCRVVMEKVIAFVGDGKKKTKFVEVLNIPHVTGIRYEEKGIFFTNQELKQFADNLLSHVCQICENRMVFPTFRHLEVHMRHQHERFPCDICTLFSEERQFFTRAALARHRRIGDDKKLGERGHPLCKFCDERYFDADMLFRFASYLFYTLSHCPPFLPFLLHTLDALKDHFRSEHFLCEIDNCANAPYGVNSNHSETMGRYLTRENRHLLELHGEFQQDWHAGSKRRSRRLEALLENKQKGIQQQPSVQQSFHLENEDFPNLNPNIASSSGVQSNNNYSSTAVTKNWKKSKEVVPLIDDFPPLSSSSDGKVNLNFWHLFSSCIYSKFNFCEFVIAPVVVVDDTADKWSPWSTVNGNKRKGKKKCDFSKGAKTELLSHTSSAAAKANSELMENQHLCSTSSELADAEQMFRNGNTSDLVKKAEQPPSQYENEFPELPVKDSLIQKCNRGEPWIQWSSTNKLSKQVAEPKKEPAVLKNLKANQPSEAHQSRSKTKFLLEPIEEKHNEAGSSKTKAKNAKINLTMMNRDADFPPLVNENSMCNTTGMPLLGFKSKLQSKSRDVVKIDVTVNETKKMPNNADMVEFLSLPGSKDAHTAGNVEYSAKTSANYSAAVLKVQNGSSTAKLKNAKEQQQMKVDELTNKNVKARMKQQTVMDFYNVVVNKLSASLNEDTTVIQSPFHAQHDSMKLVQKNANKSGAHIDGKKFKDKAGLRSNDHKQVQGKSSQKSAKGSSNLQYCDFYLNLNAHMQNVHGCCSCCCCSWLRKRTIGRMKYNLSEKRKLNRSDNEKNDEKLAKSWPKSSPPPPEAQSLCHLIRLYTYLFINWTLFFNLCDENIIMFLGMDDFTTVGWFIILVEIVDASRVKWDSAERMKKEAKSNCFNFFLHVKYPEFYEKCLPYIENRSGKKWKSGEFLKLSQYEEQSANLRGRLVASMSDNELASFENLLNSFQEGKMLAGDFFSEMMHQLGEGLFLSVFPEMISLMPNVDMQKKLLRCYITHCVNCGEDLQVRFQSVDLCHICSQVVLSVNYMEHVRLHCEEEEEL